MSPSSYHYRPLERYEIRLLNILKDEHTTIVGYAIITTNLESPPDYEAVSYVWGDPSLSHTIELTDGSTIKVTASVSRALPYLAKANTTGYLWLDQITINQHNTIERSDQVKIMGDIFSRCARCLIWIDHDSYIDPEYDSELDWTHGPGQEVLNFFDTFNEDESPEEWPSTTGEEMRKISSTSSSSSQVLTGRRKSNVKEHLLWFFEHPWFTRTWVYQEFVLAPHTTFLVDQFELPGDKIEQVFRHGWIQYTSWFDTFHHRLNMSKN